MGFRATARTPRIYRHLMGRDIISDLNALDMAAAGKKEFQAEDMDTIENLAYVMAMHYEGLGEDDYPAKSIGEWLDTLMPTDIYEAYPKIIELWMQNAKQTSKAKN